MERPIGVPDGAVDVAAVTNVEHGMMGGAETGTGPGFMPTVTAATTIHAETISVAPAL